MNLFKRILIATMDLIRPLFGFQNACCIYPESCTTYAQRLIKETSWYHYGPRIILRVLSCNPLTVLIQVGFSWMNNHKNNML